MPYERSRRRTVYSAGLVNALEPLGQEVQIAVAVALRLNLLDRRQHIVAVVAGAAVALPHQMHFLFERQPAGVLLVAAVHHVTERVHNRRGIPVGPTEAQSQLENHRLRTRSSSHLANSRWASSGLLRTVSV